MNTKNNKTSLKEKLSKSILLAFSLSLALPIGQNVFAATSSINVNFPESASQAQTKIIPLPADFDSIQSVTVDTGDVNYDIDDNNQLILSVDNGNFSSRETFYNPQLESKPFATSFRYSNTNSFSPTDSYSDDEGFTGTLNPAGSPYVVSGTLTPGPSKTVSDTQESNTSTSFPATIPYSDGIYSGTLNKIGDPVQTSNGYKYESKTVTDFRTSSGTSFPTELNYSDGSGYTGTLLPSGSYFVSSGSYTPANSKTATDYRTSSVNSFPTSVPYNNGGYTGTLYSGTSYVASGTYTASDSKTQTDSRTGTFTCSWAWSGTYWFQDGNWTTDIPRTISYNSGGYSGTLSLTDEGHRTCDFSTDVGSGPGTYAGERRTADVPAWGNYSGTVTKPASDTRVYRMDYSGTVNHPEVDTRVYRQDYSGTVSRIAKETLTINATGSRTRSSSSGFPSSIPYNTDAQGYSGTLYTSGSPYVISGTYTPSDTKTVSQTQTNSTNSFPSTVSYNSGGYSGTLNGGTPTVISGTYTPSDSKNIYQTKTDNCTDYWSWNASTNKWEDGGAGADWDGPGSYSYNSDGYSGTLRYVTGTQGPCNSSSPSTNGTTDGEIKSAPGTGMTRDFEGTVTKPEVDTRTWEKVYSGSVTKPAVDTRTWQQDYFGNPSKEVVLEEIMYTQNYTGTVYEKSSDTRIWRQDYIGTAYKGGTDYRNYKYSYNVLVNYNVSTATPSSCTYKGFAPSSSTATNYKPKCIVLNTGSTDIYSIKYDFDVTGISNAANK
ncbi:hypothetical protein MZM54_04760 [[Brevibacterium] frigoritolerans]|nr:hypothetical protein [Peribacillus frigoritolerans]